MLKKIIRTAKKMALPYGEGIDDVLCLVFKDYQFISLGSEVTAQAVFSGRAYLPVILHLAAKRIEQQLGVRVRYVSLPLEGAIFGIEIPKNEQASSMDHHLLVVYSAQICRALFGNSPGRIDLSILCEWSHDEAWQRIGLPDCRVS